MDWLIALKDQICKRRRKMDSFKDQICKNKKKEKDSFNDQICKKRRRRRKIDSFKDQIGKKQDRRSRCEVSSMYDNKGGGLTGIKWYRNTHKT